MNFEFQRYLAALEWAALSVFIIVAFQNCSSEGGLPSNLSSNGTESTKECTTCQIVINQQPEATETYEGGDVILEVRASSSKEIQYQWQKDGVNLPGENSELLILRNTTPGQSGNYGVILNNGVVSDRTTLASVIINVAPENAIAPTISREPLATNVEVGMKLELSVQATGYPNPTYQWYKDGVAINGETGPVITINKSQYSDTGAYHVEATNIGGSATSTSVQANVFTPAGIFAQDLYYRDTGGSFANGTAGASGKASCDPNDKVVSVLTTSCNGFVEENAGQGDVYYHFKDAASFRMVDNGNAVQVNCEERTQRYVKGYAKILCLKSTSSFYDFFYHRGQSLTANITRTTPEAEFYCEDGDSTLGFTHINCETREEASNFDENYKIQSSIKRVLYDANTDRLKARCQYDGYNQTKGGLGHLGCIQEPSLVGEDLYDKFSSNASKTPTSGNLADRMVQCDGDDMLVGVIEVACDGTATQGGPDDYFYAWNLNRVEINASNQVTVFCRTKNSSFKTAYGFARIRCLRKVGN